MFQNKIFLTLMMGIITCTAYGATTMNGNTNCDTNVFGNNAELKANWSANPINVNFDDGMGKVENKTCEYDGILELPEQPTKPGYQFIGWKIRSITPAEPEIPDLSEKDDERCVANLSQLNTEELGKRKRTGSLDYASNASSTVYHGITEKGIWAAEFDYGAIYGEATCNATPGTNIEVKIDANFRKNDVYPETWNEDEKYCWCRITGFTANPNPGESYNYENGPQCIVSSSGWVSHSYQNYSTMDDCAAQCTRNCAYYMFAGGNFIRTMLDITAN